MQKTTSSGGRGGAWGLLGALLVGPACSSGELPPEPAQLGPLPDEAGFIDIEPVGASELTQRLFYVFQAADSDPDEKPLVVFFNGGPGVTTEILLGFNTAKRTVDQARTNGAAVADNPSSWSRFANLLYLDAPNSGFSYALPASDTKTPAVNQFFSNNYNIRLDAAQFTRAVIRFLDSHARLTRSRVILAGESYGGVRATVMLHDILEHQHLWEGSQSDAALGVELERHFRSIFPDAGPITPEVASRQFGAQVLIEPAFEVGTCLGDTTGILLNQPDSPLFDLASRLGVPFVPCVAPCSDGTYPAITTFLLATNRNLTYNLLMTDEEDHASLYGSLAAFAHLPSLGAVLGSDPMGISGLRAESRVGAVRRENPGFWNEANELTADQQSLTDAFGELSALDQYFMVSNTEVYAAFPVTKGDSGFADPLYTRMFLQNTLHARTFITQARFDTVVYSPAFPTCFGTLPEVAQVAVDDDPGDSSLRPERMTVHFKPDAFPSEPRPLPTTTIRFPMYRESGHTVSMSQPGELSEDVEAWLGEAGK